MWVPNWLRRLIVQVALEELTIGGHCGCCGKWVADRIVWATWPYTFCDDCDFEPAQGEGDNMSSIIIEDSFVIRNQPYDALVRRVSSEEIHISAIARSIDDELLIFSRDDVQRIIALLDITPKGKEP